LNFGDNDGIYCFQSSESLSFYVGSTGLSCLYLFMTDHQPFGSKQTNRPPVYGCQA